MIKYKDMTKHELITALRVLQNKVTKLEYLHKPRHNEYSGDGCQRCGRTDSLDAVVPLDLWNEIAPKSNGTGLLCLWCMDEIALEKGLSGKVEFHYPGLALVSKEYK